MLLMIFYLVFIIFVKLKYFTAIDLYRLEINGLARLQKMTPLISTYFVKKVENLCTLDNYVVLHMISLATLIILYSTGQLCFYLCVGDYVGW